MTSRRKANITSSKPTVYDPRDLCHPEEIEAVEAECEEDDKKVESQDIENGGSEFSPSQNSSQETDLTSSQSTIDCVLSQSNDSEDTESQWTYSQSSQSYYEEDDAGDGFAEYKPSRIFQLSTTLAAGASVNKIFIDEPLTERNSVVQNEEHVNRGASWSFNSSSPLEPNFPFDSNDPETE